MPIGVNHAPVRAIALAERARDTLLAAIVTGELQPGEVLRETGLAASLGISRTPVREALHRLGEMDLVQIDSSHGYQVTPMNPERLAQMIQVAAELAGMAARLATPRLRAEDLAWFEANGGHVLTLDAPSTLSHPFGSHGVDIFIERCGNSVLAEAIARNRPHLLRLLRMNGSAVSPRAIESRATRLLAALRAGDAHRVGTAVHAYYETAGAELLKPYATMATPGRAD